MNHSLRLTAAAAVLALLGACASRPTQPNAALEEARQLYGTVSNNPTVVQGAAVELDRARKALDRADAAWNDDGDAAKTNHLAYLAKQLTVVARETGAQREAEARVQQASAERERVRAEARTAEARSAQSQAATAEARAAAAHGGWAGQSAWRTGSLYRLDALSHSRHDRTLDHRAERLVGLHPHDQCGRDRPV